MNIWSRKQIEPCIRISQRMIQNILHLHHLKRLHHPHHQRLQSLQSKRQSRHPLLLNKLLLHPKKLQDQFLMVVHQNLLAKLLKKVRTQPRLRPTLMQKPRLIGTPLKMLSSKLKTMLERQLSKKKLKQPPLLRLLGRSKRKKKMMRSQREDQQLKKL